MKLGNRKLVHKKWVHEKLKTHLQLLLKNNDSIFSKNQVIHADAWRRSKDTESLPRNLIGIIETVYIKLQEDGWGLTKQVIFISRSLSQRNKGGQCSDWAIKGGTRGRNPARGRNPLEEEEVFLFILKERKKNRNYSKEYKSVKNKNGEEVANTFF